MTRYKLYFWQFSEGRQDTDRTVPFHRGSQILNSLDLARMNDTTQELQHKSALNHGVPSSKKPFHSGNNRARTDGDAIVMHLRSEVSSIR